MLAGARNFLLTHLYLTNNPSCSAMLPPSSFRKKLVDKGIYRRNPYPKLSVTSGADGLRPETIFAAGCGVTMGKGGKLTGSE